MNWYYGRRPKNYATRQQKTKSLLKQAGISYSFNVLQDMKEAGISYTRRLRKAGSFLMATVKYMVCESTQENVKISGFSFDKKTLDLCHTYQGS